MKASEDEVIMRSTILDVGCGCGYTLRQVARRLWGLVDLMVGVDRNKSALRWGLSKEKGHMWEGLLADAYIEFKRQRYFNMSLHELGAAINSRASPVGIMTVNI